MTIRDTWKSAETFVQNKAAVDMEAISSLSELLAESVVAGSVSPFLWATWSSNERLLADFDLREAESDLWLTPLVREERKQSTRRWRPLAERTDESPAERTNADRMTLLARKYVAKEKFADEDRARLAILTERIRGLLPSVTVGEVEALAHALQVAQDIDRSDADLRKLLGMPHSSA